jgi:NAD(P)-dependent dehydrogenase (short-subunit alcohol dehydrogenase family)
MGNQKKSVVLVTGAASGIGKAICEKFFYADYKVIGVDYLDVPDPNYDLVNFDLRLLHQNDDRCKAFYRNIDDIRVLRLISMVVSLPAYTIRQIKL